MAFAVEAVATLRIRRPSFLSLSSSVGVKKAASLLLARERAVVHCHHHLRLHYSSLASPSPSPSPFASPHLASPRRHSAMPAPAVLDTIQLTDLERRIFETLKAVLAHFHLQTQLRVAGGWVRDKLLGKECYDIDIALDDMMGKDFCDKVNAYMESIGEQARGVGVIQSNPDQSKHLETAKMQMFGVWIDFVNLRSETYADNSRIPTMEFGTAEQDAYRRDLTINSLFYNINTGSIEDFTGKGISHLKSGVIATPLPPKSTFMDDPLRVLRAIRFAARFQYKLQEDLRIAAADKDVKDALANKISRERVGHEVELMLMGDYPLQAIQEMVNLGIFWTVFALPLELESRVPKETDRLCLSTLEAICAILIEFGPTKLTAEQRRICHFGALLLPLRSYSYSGKKKHPVLLTTSIIKNSLKLKNRDAEMVVVLHAGAEELHSAANLLLKREYTDVDHANERSSMQAVSAGLILMKLKEFWRVALLLSTVLELPSLWSSDLSVHERRIEVQQRAEECLSLEAVITNLGLENIWERKPLLDGKAIIDELGLKSGGPEVKEWQTRLLEWQLCHLDATLDDCLDWFRNEKVKRQRYS